MIHHTLPLYSRRSKAALCAYVTAFARLRKSRNSYRGSSSAEWLCFDTIEEAVAWANDHTSQGTHFAIFMNASLTIDFVDASLEIRETLNGGNPLSTLAPAEMPLSALDVLKDYVEKSHPQLQCHVHAPGHRRPAHFPLHCLDSRPVRGGGLQWISGELFPTDIRAVSSAAMAINCFVQAAP